MGMGTINSIEGCGEVSWEIAVALGNCFKPGNDVSEGIAAPLRNCFKPQKDVCREIDETLGNCFNQGNDVSEEIALPFVYRLNPRPLLHAFACRESAEKGCILVLKSLGIPSHTVSFVGSPFSIFHSPFSIKK